MAVIGGAAFASPLQLYAQQAANSSRVAYLGLAGDEDAVLVKQRLDELGYSEGKNLIFDFRTAEGQLERLPELAAKFVATSPDVIVSGFGTEAAKAAQPPPHHTHHFHSAGDPIAAGIVKSLIRPGANITGLTPNRRNQRQSGYSSWRNSPLALALSRSSFPRVILSRPLRCRS